MTEWTYHERDGREPLTVAGVRYIPCDACDAPIEWHGVPAPGESWLVSYGPIADDDAPDPDPEGWDRRERRCPKPFTVERVMDIREQNLLPRLNPSVRDSLAHVLTTLLRELVACGALAADEDVEAAAGRMAARGMTRDEVLAEVAGLPVHLVAAARHELAARSAGPVVTAELARRLQTPLGRPTPGYATAEEVLGFLSRRGRTISPSTWRSYVARGQAPAPARHVGRTPTWDLDAVAAWASRRV